MSLVELVVATYPGGEKHLEVTLESLHDQEGIGFKLDVVCDERYGPDKWNEGFDRCQSEFIAFPHHDDIYQPTWLAESVAALEAHPEAVACFSMDTFIDGNGRRLPGATTLPIPAKETYDYKDIINGVIRFGNFLRCETVVFRRDLAGDMRFGEPGTGTAVDTAFWFRILSAHPIVIINKPLVRYRQHAEQDTQTQRQSNKGVDHWDAMKYAASLRPEDVEWDNYIALNKMVALNDMQKEMERVKEKAKNEKRVRLVVVHEPPDAAGTGVVAAHRVREANKGEGEIAYYVYPQDTGAIQEGWFRGCPVVVCPPGLFPMVVKRFKPSRIEYQHTLFFGDEILTVETTATKELYLHDRWMWSEDPHKEGKYRDTRKYLGGVKVFGNSGWTCREAKEKLGVEIELFNPFVPLPESPVRFRKRVGFFGGFSTTKGVHILLQAARKLPDVLFVLFTQPPAEMMEGRQIYGHRNVLIMGAYARTDLHLLVHLVDLVVVPSLFESHGLVKKEIESLGVPCIATNTGGMEGTIEAGNVQKLVEAIG
jgi:glycosyltransferase involved in cell wall biosynthesis